MDFRFKFRRHPNSPQAKAEALNEAREERVTTNQLKGLGIGMTIPVCLLSGPLAGWLLGQWLDKQFHTSFLMIVLILLGTAAGLKMTIDLLSRLNKES